MGLILAPLLASLIVIASVTIARAGKLSGLPGGMKCADLFNDGSEYCLLSLEIGPITSNTVKGVKSLLEYARQRRGAVWPSQVAPALGKHVARPSLPPALVYLNSPGGSVLSAIELGRLLRSENLSGKITEGAICASACVLALAGLENRRIDGKVQIHRPRLDFDRDGASLAPTEIQSAYEEILREMRSYLREMNVNVELVDAMLRIEPDRVRTLSREDLSRYGLGERDGNQSPEQKAIFLEKGIARSAAAYGISRSEYMRRENLIEKTCHLDHYVRPGDPSDLSEYGSRIGDQLGNIHDEEAGWSRCYKMIMTYGR